MSLSLDGVRVRELARYQAGPRGGMILSDLGADVIKIERLGGEETRKNPPVVRGQSIYFTVYNRWGNIVFTTTDPNQGWDGTFKGVAQPVETYLWIAEGIDINGKKIVQKGMVSLVR